MNNEKYIDAILGPQSYHLFNKTLLNIEKKVDKVNLTEFNVDEKFDTLNNIKNSSNDVSSFLTIQEGCNKFCKFCVVPYTRGPEFSRSTEELFNECNNLVSNGVKEITLLGQNVNAYFHQGNKLSKLIEKISKIKKLDRIRYTTSHPSDFSEDLIEAHKNFEKLMPFIHLPIQSGSNKILKQMNRNHTVEEYINIIHKLEKANPRIKFSSDFIIGYPGETDKDFENTLKLLKEVKYINSYSFIYSPRPGTPAAKMEKVNYKVSKRDWLFFKKWLKKLKLITEKNCLIKKVKFCLKIE